MYQSPVQINWQDPDARHILGNRNSPFIWDQNCHRLNSLWVSALFKMYTKHLSNHLSNNQENLWSLFITTPLLLNILILVEMNNLFIIIVNSHQKMEFCGAISIYRCHCISVRIHINKVKVVLRQSYFHNGNTNTWKDVLYIVMSPTVSWHAAQQ